MGQSLSITNDLLAVEGILIVAIILKVPPCLSDVQNKARFFITDYLLLVSNIQSQLREHVSVMRYGHNLLHAVTDALSKSFYKVFKRESGCP
jgi:hypothetical protein